VTIDGSAVRVKGPKGQLEHLLVGDVAIAHDGDALNVTRADDTRSNRSLHGLQRTLIANMVIGVSDGFSKELEIVGVGYRAQAQGPNAIELRSGSRHGAIPCPEGMPSVRSPPHRGARATNARRPGRGRIRKIRKPERARQGLRYAGSTSDIEAGSAK
jgi:large subunit ribosomal protein L6